MNIFNKVKINAPKSNKFDLSHERKLSMNMGELVPIMCEEIVPGDSFRVSSEIFIRLAPMLAPIMHRVNVTTHYFFVPNRIIWDDWQKFVTGGEDGQQTASYPRLSISEAEKANFGKGTLSDYFGIPLPPESQNITQNLRVSALPFRAYTEIFNEYYRDQNVTPRIDFSKESGDNHDITEITKIRKRAWEKDYFTSALPWPQRGADVTLPVETQFTPTYLPTSNVVLQDGSITNGALSANNSILEAPAASAARVENLDTTQTGTGTSVTINELRTATRLQEWLEKNARAGSRYIEQILSHFGVRSSDARLQRPEYLGGGKSPIIISEVLQQSASASDVQDFNTPLGEMAGHGIAVGKNHQFTKSFEEHGWIIGIMSVLPRTAYQDGLPRMWSKTDKFDLFWPEFGHLGEQEIKNGEIYADYTSQVGETNLGTFGYTPRYAEYKYRESSVHGEFRDTLKYWHMGRKFDSLPALNTQFVESDPTHDIFAVTDPTEDKLYCQVFNKVSAVRPMPYFGTPYL